MERAKINSILCRQGQEHTRSSRSRPKRVFHLTHPRTTMGCGLMRSRRIGGFVFCIEETLVASVNKPWRQSLLSGQGLSEILHPLRFRQGGAKPFRCIRHKRARHTGRSAFMTAVGTKIGGTVFCIEETLVASVNNPSGRVCSHGRASQ